MVKKIFSREEFEKYRISCGQDMAADEGLGKKALDVLIKAEADTLDTLNEFLMNKIRDIESIAMTTTMIGV